MTAIADQLRDAVMLRDRDEGDTAFIFSSWLASYRKAKPVRDVAGPVYYSGQHDRIERLLEKSYVAIACDPNTPDEVLGFVVYEVIAGVLVLHWLYVKQSFRRLGIGTRLLALACGQATKGVQYTHEPVARSKGAASLIRTSRAVLNTYLAG